MTLTSKWTPISQALMAEAEARYDESAIGADLMTLDLTSIEAPAITDMVNILVEKYEKDAGIKIDQKTIDSITDDITEAVTQAGAKIVESLQPEGSEPLWLFHDREDNEGGIQSQQHAALPKSEVLEAVVK